MLREYAPSPRAYELMTVLSPEVSEEELPNELETIAGYVRLAGGTLYEALRDSPWGRRRLAYPIRFNGRDVRDGYYTVWHFDMLPASVETMEREIRLNERIMRYIVVQRTVGDEETRPDELNEGDLLKVATPPAPPEADPEPEPTGAEASAEPAAPDAEIEDPTPSGDATVSDVAPVEASEPMTDAAEATDAPQEAAAPAEAESPAEPETVVESDTLVVETTASEVEAPAPETESSSPEADVTPVAETEATETDAPAEPETPVSSEEAPEGESSKES